MRSSCLRNPVGRRAGSAFAGVLAALLLSANPAAADAHPEPAGSARTQGAHCRTSVQGSEAVALCHNPYPEADRVRLHVECARWWDIDTDSSPVESAPAMTVRLDGRCWKEIRAVWVSHVR
ncbi:hypothetical protein DSC45_11755 [Streptomyces sp. YIM 130001]|uniref:hypothetical protein n=1 Tax=Streptomyces sp. YIM 130001 TaxID=2259644 RepID=UPI000E64E954|nr:hypothetical protein [Streptomyces sp. YIM 130001]RII18586.1 hypothetical protein DSC45_11755 [Streptomyces sp. YIM 130001]